MTVDVSTWSETPASNTTIDGFNIDTGCNPGNINNAIQGVAAGIKTFHLAYLATVASLANYMPKAAGTFTGTQPIYTGEGALLHNQGSGLTSGKVFLQASGGAAPSMASGDWLLEY